MEEVTTIVFVGNALVDFAVKCEGEDLLEKYDLLPDHQYECNHNQVALFEDILRMDNVTKIPGGSAQNSARICAAISKQDNRFSLSKVFVIASIGNDENGKYLTDFMNTSGVIPLYQKSKNGNLTGTTAALVGSDGCRTLVANIAASADLICSSLTNFETEKALMSSGIVFVEGYILTNCSDVAFKLADFAASNRKLFSFGISATFVVQERFPDILKLLPICDILFGNLIEAQELSKHLTCQGSNEHVKQNAIATVQNILTSSTKKCTEIPLVKGVSQLIIITNGSGPVTVGMLLDNGKVNVKEFEVNPVKVTGDAIGAGDAFTAGVLMALLKGFTVEDSIAMGNKYSAQCLKHTGCFTN